MKKILTGILMCGGKSSRMGKNKYALLYGNTPMYQASLNVLKKFCNEIFISSNVPYPEFSEYVIVPDEIKDIGPIGGIYSCLKTSKSKYNMVLACDMPLVSGELMAQLLEIEDEFDAYIPVYNGKPEPLYGIYNSSILPTIEFCIHEGNYSLMHLLECINVYLLELTIGEIELKNVNTPNELLQNGS